MPKRLFAAFALLAGSAFIAGCSMFGGAAPAPEPVASLQLLAAPELSSTNILVGRVVTHIGAPVTDSRVVCWSDQTHQTLTNAVNEMGYFQTQPLRDGRWHVRAENVRFAPSHVIEFTVGGSQTLPLLLFPLHHGGVLRVQLRDANRDPIRHARVEALAAEGYNAILRDTGAGTYECEQSMPLGELTVRASAKDLSPAEGKTTIMAGLVTQLELTLTPAPPHQTKP